MHILLAEDNPINQQVVRRMLGRMDHSVYVVTNGREAVEEAERSTYDVILMDMMMPEMDGMQAASTIREAGNTVHMVALTANATSRDRSMCMASGMNDFLSKPFSLDQLRAVLERVPDRGLHAIDPSVLHVFLSSIGDDPAFLRELFQDFFADAHSCLSETHAALASGDGPAVRRAMHTLKANSAIFGADTMAELCGRLEHLAEENDLDAISRDMPTFEEALDLVSRDIKSLMSRYTQDKSRGAVSRVHSGDTHQVLPG